VELVERAVSDLLDRPVIRELSVRRAAQVELVE
jgi:hypothetical protein